MGLTPEELATSLRQGFVEEYSDEIAELFRQLQGMRPGVILEAVPLVLASASTAERKLAANFAEQQGHSEDPHSPEQSHLRMAAVLEQYASLLATNTQGFVPDYKGAMNPFLAQSLKSSQSDSGS